MRILAIADEESKMLWDYFKPERLEGVDLILSAGDLKAEYLSFLVTMAQCPLLYVHGNHDGRYARKPPEGCFCVEDKLVLCQGLRILGLGGCMYYGGQSHQYTQKQMRNRVKKLKRAIAFAGGVDVVLTHAAPKGVGDDVDLPHQGFEAFLPLMDIYKPQCLIHGHVHLRYGVNIPRVQVYGETQVVNCCEKYQLECERPTLPPMTPARRLYARLFLKNFEIID